MNNQREQEANRIRAEFKRRQNELPSDFYALYRPANLFMRHSQETALLRALDRAQLLPLAQRRILDLGCGHGQWLATLEHFGAQRDKLAGIDLDEDRAVYCRERFPGSDVRCGDASQLPWTDAYFDVVFQSTVFTSILNADMKRDIAAEILRVLQPRGYLVWYDFAYNNPRNRNVRGIGRNEIRRLFPGCRMRCYRATLAPPLARRLAPVSFTLAATLQSLRILNTHYLILLWRE